MKQFKIRCSAIGQIMGQPHLKAAREAGELSQTAKTYCQTWLKEQLYDRRKDFDSKHTQKGNEVEDHSIDFVADYFEYGFLMKNETFYENDFITGTPDVILKDTIIDVKNSWDCFTFPLFETEIPNKDYYWQGQGYMHLLGVENYRLIYTLMNTPLHLIEKEAYYYCKNNGYEDLDEDIYEQFVEKMTYDEIPRKLRIKAFDFKRNDTDIELIKEQVEKCRTYIKTLIK